MKKITALIRVCVCAAGLCLVDQHLLTGIYGMIKHYPAKLTKNKIQGAI